MYLRLFLLAVAVAIAVAGIVYKPNCIISPAVTYSLVYSVHSPAISLPNFPRFLFSLFSPSMASRHFLCRHRYHRIADTAEMNGKLVYSHPNCHGIIRKFWKSSATDRILKEHSGKTIERQWQKCPSAVPRKCVKTRQAQLIDSFQDCVEGLKGDEFVTCRTLKNDTVQQMLSNFVFFLQNC